MTRPTSALRSLLGVVALAAPPVIASPPSTVAAPTTTETSPGTAPTASLSVAGSVQAAPEASTSNEGDGPAGLAGLAQRLAILRTTVEALHADVERQRADDQAAISSAERRRSEVQADLERAVLRRTQLRERITREQASQATARESEQQLLPTVQAGTRALRAEIEASIPYRRRDRLAVLDEIDAACAAGRVEHAALRLWAAMEDERRLARESSLDTMVLRLDGEEHLVDVARIGLVTLLYKRRDGGVGIVRSSNTTEPVAVGEAVADPDAARAIEVLFERFRRQVRVGAFALPAAAIPPINRDTARGAP